MSSVERLIANLRSCRSAASLDLQIRTAVPLAAGLLDLIHYRVASRVSDVNYFGAPGETMMALSGDNIQAAVGFLLLPSPFSVLCSLRSSSTSF